jgi:aminoglycoside 6'-N-acetyltransferase
MTTLHGAIVRLRPATRADVPELATIRATPEVYARWRGGTDLAHAVEQDLDEPGVTAYVIELGGRTVGWIQWDAEEDPDYRHAGIDIYVDPAVHGRGVGTDAVRTLARHLVHDHGHHRLTIDPAADNAPAIRSYTKVGFRPVGIMRRYERGADDTWHDSLLMDLLAEEVIGPERDARTSAGPDEAELERLGLYEPGAPGADDRLRVLRRAFSLGATVDEVVRGTRRHDLNSLILDLSIRPPGETQDLETFADRSGVDAGLVRRLWVAFGLPQSDAVPIRVTPDAAEALEFVAGMTAEFGEEVALALARVVGSSVNRMAEAVSGAFRIGIETPKRTTGATDSDVVEASTAAARDLLPPFLDLVAAMFRRHLVGVSYQMWSTDEDRAAVTLERTVGFADLVGSTDILRSQSVKEMAAMVRRFEELVWDLVTRAGGRVVKLIGDEAMFVLERPEPACEIALTLVDAAPHPVRVGLAHGPVVELYVDYYGETVNLAARLVHEAAPRTLLVSEAVRARGGPAFTFEARGPLLLKGFGDPLPAYRGARA